MSLAPFAATPTARPPKMGKKKSDIYSCFQILPMKNKANKSIFMCKFCDRQYLQNATKMESHIVTQCQKVPPDIRLSYAKVHGGGGGPPSSSSSASSLLITRRPSPSTDSNSTLDDRPNTPINLSQFAAANRSRLNQVGGMGGRGNVGTSAAASAANSLLQQFQQQRSSFNGMKRSGGGATLTRISTINNNNNGSGVSLLKKPKLMSSMEAAAGTVLGRRAGGVARQDKQGNYSSRLIGSSGGSSNGGGGVYGGSVQGAGRAGSKGDAYVVSSRCGVILKKTNSDGATTATRGPAAGNNGKGSGGSLLESHPLHQQPMDHKELIEVWKLLARALYSTGCGLSLFENDFFKGAFKRLRPSFTLPTTYALANTLLGEEYLRLKHKIDNQINKCNFVTVQCQLVTRGDTLNEQHALSFFVFPPCMEPNQSQQILYRIVPLTLTTRDEKLSDPSKSTKETLTSIIASTVEDIGAHKVLAFVSSPCLSFAYDKLRSTFPGLIAFSCVFESLISLLDGFLEFGPVKELALKGKTLVDQTKGSSVLKKKFQETQRQLKLPPVPAFKFSGKSKYSSLAKCLALLTSQKAAFRQLCEGDDTKDLLLRDGAAAAAASVTSEFWNEVDSITNVVVPLSNWIKIMEPESSPTISLVPQVFHELKVALTQESLPAGTREEFLARLQAMKSACLNELHYAACLLNPKIFCSKKEVLPENEEEEGAEFIHYFCGTREFDVAVGLQELHQYRHKQGCFNEEESNKGMWELARSVQDPVSWWKTLRPAASLSHVAMSLLNISACVHPHPDAGDLMCANGDEGIVDQEQQEKLAFLKCHLQKGQVLKKSQDSHFGAAGFTGTSKRGFGSSKVEQPTSSGQSANSLLSLRDRGTEWSSSEMELCNQMSEFPMEEDVEPMDVTQFLSQSHEDEEQVGGETEDSDAEEVKDVKVGIKTNGCLSKSSSGSSSNSGGVLGVSVLGSNDTATTVSVSPSPKIKMEVKVEQEMEEEEVEEDNAEPPPPEQVAPSGAGDDDEDDDDSSSSSDSSDDSSSSSSSSSSSNSNTESKV